MDRSARQAGAPDGTGAGGLGRLFRQLEARCGVMFLLAGLLLAVSSGFNAISLFTPLSVRGPQTFLPEFLAPIVAYLGFLGLFPRLAAAGRRAGLAALLLLTFPVVATVLGFGYFLLQVEPAFIVELYLVIYAGYAVGSTGFGALSAYTAVPSRAVGLALLVYAVPWYALVAMQGLTPVEVDLVAFGTMSAALLAAGWLIARAPGPRFGLAPRTGGGSRHVGERHASSGRSRRSGSGRR